MKERNRGRELVVEKRSENVQQKESQRERMRTHKEM